MSSDFHGLHLTPKARRFKIFSIWPDMLDVGDDMAEVFLSSTGNCFHASAMNRACMDL
jgi:hypothetical protein